MIADPTVAFTFTATQARLPLLPEAEAGRSLGRRPWCKHPANPDPDRLSFERQSVPGAVLVERQGRNPVLFARDAVMLRHLVLRLNLTKHSHAMRVISSGQPKR